MIYSKITGSEEGVVDYPKLMVMKEGGYLILMTGEDTGTALRATNPGLVGEFSDCWDADRLEDYKGEITLSNEAL